MPDGIHSHDQHVWSIKEEDTHIGVLWVQVRDGRAFIYDFVIDEQYRGTGYGKQALAEMDERLKSMDVSSVGLHVFGDNTSAQELYKKMGFVVAGIHMQKKYR